MRPRPSCLPTPLSTITARRFCLPVLHDVDDFCFGLVSSVFFSADFEGWVIVVTCMIISRLGGVCSMACSLWHPWFLSRLDGALVNLPSIINECCWISLLCSPPKTKRKYKKKPMHLRGFFYSKVMYFLITQNKSQSPRYKAWLPFRRFNIEPKQLFLAAHLKNGSPLCFGQSGYFQEKLLFAA